jgi:protein-tyrosine phosphatase
MPSVAFICTANVCRSPMAHAIFASEIARRNLKITVLSAGLLDFEGVLVANEARLTCQKHNAWLPKFAATYIRNVDLSGVTRVFVMERGHIPQLLELTSLSPERVSILGDFDPHKRGAEIDDPMGKDSIQFERCFDRLKDCIVHYLDMTDEYDRAT